MISLSSILNRLDLVFYIIVFAIIYVAIIYLWKKIAQLESSFYKLETTFATQLLYKNKENNANQFAEDMFMKVLQMNQDADQGDIRFKRELAKQNFAYKYDVDMMALSPLCCFVACFW